MLKTVTYIGNSLPISCPRAQYFFFLDCFFLMFPDTIKGSEWPRRGVWRTFWDKYAWLWNGRSKSHLHWQLLKDLKYYRTSFNGQTSFLKFKASQRCVGMEVTDPIWGNARLRLISGNKLSPTPMDTHPLAIASCIAYPTEEVEAGNSFIHNHEFKW